MTERMMQIVSVNRKKMVPVLIALSLLAGLFVSVFHTMKAQADYYAGCGWGYNSTGTTYGYGTGLTYGFGVGGTFANGYGSGVCPLAITTVGPPPATVGTPYSQTFSGTGGVTPYTWTATGTLPPGLTMSSGGILSGTPTAAGTYPFTVTMTDANGQPKSGAFSIASAPTTTTTMTPGNPGLIYRHVVRTTVGGVFIQFKCTNAANCHALGKLLVRERARTARGFKMMNTTVAWARFSIGRGQTATKFLPFNRAGKARYGGTRHFHHVGLQLWTSVAGGGQHTRYVWLNR